MRPRRRSERPEPTTAAAREPDPLAARATTYLREEILARPAAARHRVARGRARSEQLGVSRGPIREAIGRLAAEGLVTVRPRRGAVVRSLSADEFLELYQVREALEAMAVRLAVPRLGPRRLRGAADADRHDGRARRPG